VAIAAADALQTGKANTIGMLDWDIS